MYREHAPPALLAPRVECIWTIDAHVPPGRVLPQRVLPDGCMDVLFDLGDPPLPQGPRSPRSYVVGAMPTARVFGMRERVSLVGVRFRPGGAADLLGFPAREATGGVVELEAVWGAAAREIEERLAEAGGREERARMVAEAVAARPRAGEPADVATAAASAAIGRSGGAVTIARLAAEVGFTRRTLERRFAEEVGLTPKQAARVERLRRAVRLLGRNPPLPLARVAFAAGYHDQPHLTREFGALAGIAPAAWRRERERQRWPESGSEGAQTSSTVASVQDDLPASA